MNLAAKAQAAGYQEETCAACHGAGRSERLYIGAPGVGHEDPCLTCEGTGRMWSRYDQLPWMRDSELHAKLGA